MGVLWVEPLSLWFKGSTLVCILKSRLSGSRCRRQKRGREAQGKQDTIRGVGDQAARGGLGESGDGFGVMGARKVGVSVAPHFWPGFPAPVHSAVFHRELPAQEKAGWEGSEEGMGELGCDGDTVQASSVQGSVQARGRVLSAVLPAAAALAS